LNDHDVQTLLKYVKPIDLKKKEYLLEQGQICKGNYFVEKGCLRMFFINDKNAEQITQFALETWWLADYFSLADKTPSEYYIQAIEKSEILAVEAQVQEDLFRELPQLERYFRIVMHRALAASQLRIKYLYELSKEELFVLFSTSFPGFVQRVPQYMIASYLGLTPEYVSELRKKKT
jgi:CRP-like cAMP-binding protein